MTARQSDDVEHIDAHISRRTFLDVTGRAAAVAAGAALLPAGRGVSADSRQNHSHGCGGWRLRIHILVARTPQLPGHGGHRPLSLPPRSTQETFFL